MKPEIKRLYEQVQREEEASGDYWDCDIVANRFSDLLIEARVPHQLAVGYSDEGSSHAWVIVDGENLDPTEQGFGSGLIEWGEAR